MQYLEQNDIPCILSPGRTVRALASLNEFTRKKDAFAARPRQSTQRAITKQKLDLPAASGTLGEHRSKQALAAYGIPIVKEVLLNADDVANLTASPLPFPLAVKIESADIPHKTEAGVVRLNIRTLDELKNAARDVLAAAQKHPAKARIDGIIVQEMASGLEVIAGAVTTAFSDRSSCSAWAASTPNCSRT